MCLIESHLLLSGRQLCYFQLQIVDYHNEWELKILAVVQQEMHLHCDILHVEENEKHLQLILDLTDCDFGFESCSEHSVVCLETPAS